MSIVTEPGTDLFQGVFLTFGEMNSVYENVMSSGWNHGIGEFLYELPLDRAAFIAKLLHERSVGWKYLLNIADTNQSVLVLDSTLGTLPISLAKHINSVSALYMSSKVSECVQKRILESGLENRVRVEGYSDSESLPFSDKQFDMVLMPFMDISVPAGLKKQHSDEYVNWLISESTRVCKTTGSVCASFRNKYDYQKLRNCLNNKYEESASKLSLSQVKKIFNQNGCSEIISYSIVPSLENMATVHPNGRKDDCKQLPASGIKRKIKSLIFHSSFIAPSYLVIASSEIRVPFIETLLSALSGRDSTYLTWAQYIVSNGGAIVSFRSGAETEDGGTSWNILKLPLGSMHCSCSDRIKMLGEVRAVLGSYVDVSDPVASGVYNGQEYSVETMLDGSALDEPLPLYDEMIAKSASLLLQFHQVTCIQASGGDEYYGKYIAPIVDELRDRSPENSLKIDMVELYLRKCLKGKLLPAVWQHGDYKLENILINIQLKNIVGVIDWDHSDKNGLPVLDLIHLIATREKIFQEKDLDRIICYGILPLSLSEGMKSILKNYCIALQINLELIPFFIVLYWIHHVVVRCGVSDLWHNREWLERNISDPLDVIGKLYIR